MWIAFGLKFRQSISHEKEVIFNSRGIQERESTESIDSFAHYSNGQ
jgi:hypothetical protein